MTTPDHGTNSLTRRNFVRTAAVAATALGSGLGLAPTAGRAADHDPAPAGKPMVGFQVEVPYILQYGIDRFLDDVQTRASVNALYLHFNLFEASLDPARKGEFATAHPEYYHDIGMQPGGLAAGNFNLAEAMAKIREACRARGVKVYAWFIEDNRPQPKVNGIDRLYEVDLHGRRTTGHPGGPCANNPYFRNLLMAETEDIMRTFEVDGVQRGSERQGPLWNALGSHDGADIGPGHTSCFCEYCLARGKSQGIDTDRVKAAYLALEQYVQAGRADRRPADGYYVEFWRLLLRYPELLSWETLWTDSMRDTQRMVYAKVKSIRDVPVGYHIWQVAAFNPMFRAEQDYAPYLDHADFLKPVVYDNPAAQRIAAYVLNTHQSYLGDLGKEQALQFLYSVMGYSGEKTYDEITGGDESTLESPAKRRFPMFSSDFVLRETRRCVQATAGSKVTVWAGFGVDVAMRNSTPESVRGAVKAVFEAGATGLIICTAHSNMRPENLSAVGSTLRELKLA